jgi:hypothetical protein
LSPSLEPAAWVSSFRAAAQVAQRSIPVFVPKLD